MKLTNINLLAAALATSCFATPIAIEKPLPAKFTLRFTTPTSGTGLDQYLGKLTVNSFFGGSIFIGNPGYWTLNINLLGDSGKVHYQDLGGTPYYIFISPKLSNTVYLYEDSSTWAQNPDWTLGGFVQYGNILAYNNGQSGPPESLWKACPWSNGSWQVWWDGDNSADCIKIDLTVVEQ